MATIRPVARYIPAIFQPNNPNNITKATSLTIGALTRKENVTPKGTPVVTKPMKSGTAEQEQNRVTMPNIAANTTMKRKIPGLTGDVATLFAKCAGNESIDVASKIG